MQTLLAALAIVALVEQTPGRLVTLPLPRPLETGDAVWVQVTLGELARGSEIILSTTAGRVVGVISPHGIRSGQESGKYTVPVPSEAIADNRVSLRLSIDQSGRSRRPATPQEVKNVQVRITHPER